MKNKQVLQGIFWASIYVILFLAPLFLMLIGPSPPGRELWRELSVSLGFVGLAMMMIQYVLTARFQWLKALTEATSYITSTARLPDSHSF